MTLNNILAAIKPQFVWEDKNELQANKLFYNGAGSAGLAEIVFIGVAYLNGFKKHDVKEYLHFETWPEYNNKLNQFKKAVKEYKAGKKGTRNQTIYIKTELTCNYLNRHKGSISNMIGVNF